MSEKESVSHKKVVLLVVHHEEALGTYASSLEQAGYYVVQAKSVAEARDAVRALSPDVVVLDHRLPDGDGLAVLQTWRASRTPIAHALVIVLAASAQRHDTHEALAAGADDVVAKPCGAEVLADHVSRALEAARAQPVSRPGAPLVLVVDDFEDNRLLYASTIAEAGYPVAEARDGAEALAKIGAARPAVIIMDLSMPMLDGWEATRQLKADPRTAGIVIIAVTGHTTHRALDQARDAGADAVLTKPCLPQDLLGVIDALIPAG